MEPKHYSVMLPETLEFLAVKPDGLYLDCTAGLGGHTAAIAKLLTTGRLISNDRDLQSLELARRNAAAWSERIEFQHGNFSAMTQQLSRLMPAAFDGILADLGVSRYQLTDPGRGFSFMSEGPLDMRMDTSGGMTAADLVNHSAEKAIADWIYQLGEERRARRIARAIVRARPVRSTLHLADVVERAVPRTGPIHPATRTFMALRLLVNGEQQELDALLKAVPDLAKPGGRVVIISFMSLEDRKVKDSFRELAKQNKAELLTKKPLEPSEREVMENPASRSAKLRAIRMRGLETAEAAGIEEVHQSRYRRKKQEQQQTEEANSDGRSRES